MAYLPSVSQRGASHQCLPRPSARFARRRSSSWSSSSCLRVICCTGAWQNSVRACLTLAQQLLQVQGVRRLPEGRLLHCGGGQQVRLQSTLFARFASNAIRPALTRGSRPSSSTPLPPLPPPSLRSRARLPLPRPPLLSRLSRELILASYCSKETVKHTHASKFMLMLKKNCESCSRNASPICSMANHIY